jgi:drug/metabolite transporter (DMT)-like permease
LFVTERRRGVFFSVCGALCSAIYLFPYKRAAELAPAGILAFALLLVAALLSSLLWLWERRPAPASASVPNTPRGVLWRTALLLSVITITGNFCGAQAVALLEPAMSSVLLRTEVVFVGVMSALLLGEPVTRPLALGAGVALLGLGVMNWPLALGSLPGALWSLGAAASFGLMQVLTRRVIARVSPTSVNTLRLWLAVALMACVPHTLAGLIGLGARFWLFVAAAAAFGPFAGRLLIMYSLRDLRAAQSALLLLLAPLFAFALGYLFRGSVPSLQQALGSAMMLAGIALPSLASAASLRRPLSNDLTS